MPTDSEPAILYVDDEPLNLRVFHANFKNRFRILSAQSAEEAFGVIGEHGPEIGIILSDQRMPGMSGSAFLEKSRDLVPDAQRMLLTAYSDMQAVMDAVNLGQVSRYFVKPWVKEELMAALEDGLRIYTLQVKLRQIENRMLRSERLAAIGQVSAGVAHELMNPVGYMSQNVTALRLELERVLAYVRPLLKEFPNSEVLGAVEDLPSMLADVETGAKHIRQVALQVRSQARGDDTEKYSELSEVVGFATKIARSEVQLVARIVMRGPKVRVVGGPVKLCQVLLNLIVNSAHAMNGEGRTGLVEVFWEMRDEDVRVRVKDNGAGIPKALLEKVFEPMFTTKPAGEGTGLGLPICRDIIHDLGGELTLQSEEGVGTVVEFTLQRAPAESAQA